ncbi:toll/interleukin-1 receptor domain-containing protein [Paraburkholderia tropica]|uniref:toll/interleukin-1 receptor domain-containing protein n=1 Tax=Paraburkholderia tropica TaxID=92647 RepID=UPI000B1B869E|nr:toll/interleukin-1 receptor domain-containing protein [Paraburkholderia tropica]
MNKAFLSHNSFDKDFVGAVFDRLGALQSIYDKETFKRNCDLAEQIREGLYDSKVYVLFLSRAALDSGWVRNELDLANELKTKWQIKEFLIFQLDDTNWSDLPAWASRFVVSCPPSPGQVALRIRDVLRKEKIEEQEPYGRDLDIRKINEMVLHRDTPPKFLFLSGPTGIGRRTIANAVFKSFYKTVASHKIRVEFNAHDDIGSLYRNLLGYSANWRARELFEAMEAFSALHETEKIAALAKLINTVTVNFNQILILDVGGFAFDNDSRPLGWLISLLSALGDASYPYLIILSSRNMESVSDEGIFYHLRPLSEVDSKYLFKMLINQFEITLPSKKERDLIENSVIGHPGLIVAVVNYLRHNPHYRPNKTHSSIIQLIRVEVEKMLLDFLNGRSEHEKAVAFFGEAYILSYADIVAVNECWKNFDEIVSQLLDTGFVVEEGGNYQLAPYIQRHAQNLSAKYFSTLESARRAVFDLTAIDSENSYVSTELLDARIVEHFVSGTQLPTYMSNLVMPAQQLKAARREYDGERHKRALQLAIDAYSQQTKLSQNGLIEAWRLIGLASIRLGSDSDFAYFEDEFKKLPKSDRRDATYNFAKGLKARLNGNLREALPPFEKVISMGMADAHCLREAAYIYAFDGRYDVASERVREARRLVPSNPYIVDMEAFVLLERFRKSKDSSLLSELDGCLDRLKDADDREGTHFYPIRKSMMDVFVHNQVDSVRQIYSRREKLSTHPKLALLDLLSTKGKNDQYDQLLSELEAALRSKPNRLAEIELAKIKVVHFSYAGKFQDAEDILRRFKNRLTDTCIEGLTRLIGSSKAQTAR